MTKEELIKIAKEKEACEKGLEWMEDHEIEDLKSKDAIEKEYWIWVWRNAPECRDQIRHDKPVLDELVNDKNSYVRAAVARQGYGLDKLVNDKNSYVRVTLAEQGYGLGKLVNDEDGWVREVAEIKLKEMKEND